MAKSIHDALAEVQRKVNEQRMKNSVTNHNAIQEATPAMGPDKPVSTVKTKGGNYDVYKKGSATAGEFQSMYGAAKKAGAGTFEWQGRKYAVPGGKGEYKPPAAAEAPKPAEPAAPAAPQGSQSPEGNGNVDKGVTAAPVAPASSGEEGIAKANAISATDRAIENNARSGTSSQLSGKPLEADGSNATPAQFVNANRAAGAAGGTTMGSARQLGTIAAAGNAGGAGDEAARASMPADQKAKIDSEAAARQADMNAEREKNLAAQAAKRAAASAPPAASTTSSSPSLMDRAKSLFGGSSEKKPTEVAASRSAEMQKVSDSQAAAEKPKETPKIETEPQSTAFAGESSPKKEKKKMSESTLINAFLKLQATEHSNIFEAAKKAKKDWDGDGKVESGKDEYLGSKIAAAKKAGKMEEELKGDQDKIDANKNNKIDTEDFKMLRGKKKMKEDVEFSEAELAHFEAVIARKDQKGKERGIGDTVPSENLTDEYINEMAQRGVKAGTKRGSYKGKAHKGGADATGASMPDEGPKGVPHVLDQIRHGQEDEHGFKSITHPASSPDAPVTKKIHRSDLHGFYDRYHNTEKPAGKEKEYTSFLGKHFGDERTSSPTHKSVTTDLSKVEKANLKGGGAKPSLGGSKLVGGSK